MKQYFPILPVLAAMLVFTSCGTQSDSDALKTTPPDVRFFGVQNVKVEYEYGGASSGLKTHIIANYGMYQYVEDHMVFTVNGAENDMQRLDITVDSMTYAIDLVKKTGTKLPFDFEGLAKFTAEFTEEEKMNFSKAYAEYTKMKEIGKKEILGKECTVYQMDAMGVEIAMWQGITLESRIIMMADTMFLNAISIDTDIVPTADMFKVPEGIEITERRPMTGGMPAGHPPVDDGEMAPGGEMPSGHPPVQGGEKAPSGDMPAGHPPVN